jgi:hypothetical protein
MKDARTLLKQSEIIEVLNFSTQTRATRTEWRSLNRKNTFKSTWEISEPTISLMIFCIS